MLAAMIAGPTVSYTADQDALEIGPVERVDDDKQEKKADPASEINSISTKSSKKADEPSSKKADEPQKEGKAINSWATTAVLCCCAALVGVALAILVEVKAKNGASQLAGAPSHIGNLSPLLLKRVQCEFPSQPLCNRVLAWLAQISGPPLPAASKNGDKGSEEGKPPVGAEDNQDPTPVATPVATPQIEACLSPTNDAKSPTNAAAAKEGIGEEGIGGERGVENHSRFSFIFFWFRR